MIPSLARSGDLTSSLPTLAPDVGSLVWTPVSHMYRNKLYIRKSGIHGQVVLFYLRELLTHTSPVFQSSF